MKVLISWKGGQNRKRTLRKPRRHCPLPERTERERFCFALYCSDSRIVRGACCPVSYGNMQKNSALSVDAQAFLRGLEEHLLSWVFGGQAEVEVRK